MNPLSVPNSSLTGIYVCVLWQVLQSVQKVVAEEEEKNAEKNPKLWPLISRKWLE